jgi:hypothetical protein
MVEHTLGVCLVSYVRVVVSGGLVVAVDSHKKITKAQQRNKAGHKKAGNKKAPTCRSFLRETKPIT